MSFVEPSRAIKSAIDVAAWKASQAYSDYVQFINDCCTAVKRRSCKDPCQEDDLTKRLLQLLTTLNEWIDAIPPIDQPQRFGNKAFREWHEKLTENATVLCERVLGDEKKEAAIELRAYLLDSFGNSTRIDYGTGHEACFLMFLLCLKKLELIQNLDSAILLVFDRYMRLVRRLQRTYRMEPAGSHGVWSLDDYQFLPFILGSAQLLDHPQLEPSSFLQPEVVKLHADDYLFMAAIDYINEVKTGPFYEHSNQLYNISGVPRWSKVNQGLIRMYEAEVLAKFPVVQHFVFGSLFSIAKKS